MSPRNELHPSVARFSDTWNRRSEAQLRELAHIKRFLECLVGDPNFRDELTEHVNAPRVVADKHGIDVDPDLMRPLFHAPFMKHRFEHADDRWPLAKRWDIYIKELLASRDALLAVGDTESINPNFHKWRRRQIARVSSELGQGATGIVHPIIAYELSKGCTVGCWFCGISAEKFGGYWPYTSENARLWRGMLEAVVDRFGFAAQTGFCYWATDPTDNPDYVDFIQAHHEVTGVVPQTTTAAPLRNTALTRRILQLFDTHRCIINRFSILSVGQLRRVHAEFTAEELLGVEFVLQNSGALTGKALAGRALERSPDTEPTSRQPRKSMLPATPKQAEGTIACVSGFLVRPLEHRIQLISPCRANDKWPDGYRIWDEASFSTAKGFGTALDALIDKHMQPSLRGTDRLAFRPDLKFEPTDSGFRLGNDRGAGMAQGAAWISSLGQMIGTGGATVADATGRMLEQRASVFEVTSFLDGLFQGGMLDDDPRHGGIGRHQELRPRT